MSDLSQEAKALLAQGRTTLSPDAEQLRAVHSALTSKLAATASVAAGKAAVVSGPTRGLLGKLLLSSLALVGVGGVVWTVMLVSPHAESTGPHADRPLTMAAEPQEPRPFAEPLVLAQPLGTPEQAAPATSSRNIVTGSARGSVRASRAKPPSTLMRAQSAANEGTASESTANKASQPSEPADATPVVAAPAPPQLPTKAKPSQTEQRVAPITTTETLREETRLLRAARGALEANHAAQSVAFLDQHAERFPHGVLHEERLALRAIALCRLGQHSVARNMIDELRKLYPSSPQLPPTLAACTQRDD